MRGLLIKVSWIDLSELCSRHTYSCTNMAQFCNSKIVSTVQTQWMAASQFDYKTLQRTLSSNILLFDYVPAKHRAHWNNMKRPVWRECDALLLMTILCTCLVQYCFKQCLVKRNFSWHICMSYTVYFKCKWRNVITWCE